MFGIGMPEMILILAVALIVIGPKKLPDLAKSLGRALGEFKKATNDFKESISMDSTLNEVKDEFKEVGKKMKEPLSGSSDSYKKDPGTYSKSESTTASETADMGNNDADAEKTEGVGPGADQNTADAEPLSDIETEKTVSEPIETEKATAVEAEPVSTESAVSSAKTENDDNSGSADSAETGASQPDTISPDDAKEGPLKDA